MDVHVAARMRPYLRLSQYEARYSCARSVERIFPAIDAQQRNAFLAMLRPDAATREEGDGMVVDFETVVWERLLASMRALHGFEYRHRKKRRRVGLEERRRLLHAERRRTETELEAIERVTEEEGRW